MEWDDGTAIYLIDYTVDTIILPGLALGPPYTVDYDDKYDTGLFIRSLSLR